MMEKKHNEPYDESYYDELIKQRIGEALRNQSRKEKLDLAQLEAWVEEDRQRRRAKVKRILAIASCFVILCVGAFSLKFAFDPADSVVTAGKNDNKVNEEGNNVVVKPNEDGAGENVGIRKVKYDSLQDIKKIKKKFPRLMKPNYVPVGYKFSGLLIEYTDLMESYNYRYSNGKDDLEIKQVTGGSTIVFSEFERKLICKYGDLVVVENETINAGCKTEKGVVYVSIRDCTDEQLIKIVDSME